MAKGLSIHIGVNEVSAAHYAGWTGPLAACEADAMDMHDLARSLGYAAHPLLTRAAVLADLDRAAKDLVAGDILFVSYAGHGGQLPDENGDEDDDVDETWCLYDGQLCDDEIAVAWSKLAPGVRVILLSDSCHSGSVSRLLDPLAGARVDLDTRYRAAPADVMLRTLRGNRGFYDAIVASLPGVVPVPRATVRLISGCQDDQVSADGPFNGRFTGALKRVWDAGRFEGDYAAFHAAIVARMPADQQPNHLVIGPPDPAFDTQRPFHIG